jgi:hypothetical protein
MRRTILSLLAVLTLMLAGSSPVIDSVALAAQKRSACNCKPTLRRRTKHSARAVGATRRPVSARANASVVGPVFATYTLPANQHFRLKMNQTISSETVRRGDRFKGTVMIPVYASGVEVVPAGSIVEGHITSVVPARSRGREGQLSVAFDAVVLPDGTRHPIDGALTEVQDQKAGEVDAENRVSGHSSETRKIAYVGGGGGGGALIGAAIGGGKGAAIGAAIGAGAGIAGVMLTKGNEAVLRSGTEVGMITNKPVVFSIRSDRQR